MFVSKQSCGKGGVRKKLASKACWLKGDFLTPWHLLPRVRPSLPRELGDGTNWGRDRNSLPKVAFLMQRVTAQTGDIPKPAENLRRLLSCFAHFFSVFFCSCGSIFFQTHGKIEEEIQALRCIFSEAKGFSEAVWKSCRFLPNDDWAKQSPTRVLTLLRSLHLCWWKQIPPASVSPLHFPLSSSRHISSLFIFFGWGFSESPNFQPVFGQRVIKELELSTHMYLFNIWDLLRGLSGPNCYSQMIRISHRSWINSGSPL